jgi:succinoglycan biosynthesis protein ExoA
LNDPAIPDDLVTVVIPARNEEAAIGACLDSILAQEHRELQVIVVDGASEDRTAAIVKEYAERDPRVELLINPERIIPRSLNLAVAQARARWLVRVDAHAHVPPNYVGLALQHLRTGRWGGVGGRKDGVGGGPAGDAIAAAMASRFGVGGSTYHHGTTVRTVEHVPFGAYPLDVVRELGGWDESLRVNQDFEFDYRVRASGRELLFDPDLVIAWENRTSLKALFDQYRRYGRGKVKVAHKHPASLRPRHLMAPALVGLLSASGVVALRDRRVAGLMLTPYLLALTTASATTARGLPRPARRYVAPAFVAMHVGWGSGFLQAALELARRSAGRRGRAR